MNPDIVLVLAILGVVMIIYWALIARFAPTQPMTNSTASTTDEISRAFRFGKMNCSDSVKPMM